MNPMIRFFVAVISMLAIIGLVNKGYCDTLHSNYDDWRNYAHYFQFLDVSNNNGWGNAETIKIENADTDQLFRAFCIDHDTMTSPEFNNPLIGQNYDPVALNSPSMTLYTQSQKDALNSLFSHVYSTVYDFDGNIIDDASAYFYQLVVWEIIHETSGTFNISNGTFGIQAAATYIDPDNHDGGSFDDWDYYHSTVAAANSWLDAISGTITWESIGYGTVTNHELTVYVAEGGQSVSQTFISVVGHPALVPEPATMLIFGIGIVTLPCLRRVRKIVRRS